LSADNNGVDAQKPVVPKHALEDIELVVEAAAVEFVENLHPHEGVEDNCGKLFGSKIWVAAVKLWIQKLVPREVQHEDHSEFVDCLSEDHLPHVHGEEWGTFGYGFSIQNFCCRAVGGSVSPGVSERTYMP
jgi:hypothetical protein